MYSSATWNYKDAGDIVKLQQVHDNAIYLSEHRIFGCEADVTGSDTAIIQGGRMEINGTWLYRTGTDTSGLALTASEARIRDTDVAREASNLTKAQILVQAGTAVLAQANIAPQNALALLG